MPYRCRDCPTGVHDALRYDEPQRQHGHHHPGPRPGPTVPPVHHGHGIGGELQKERLGRYLHAVNQAVSPVLRHGRAPLVLAGVDRITAGYRQVNSHPHLLVDGLPGSPDHVPAAELHTRAWLIVAEQLARARNDAVAKVRRQLGTGHATDEMPDSGPVAATLRR